jgi:hypothetical protein
MLSLSVSDLLPGPGGHAAQSLVFCCGNEDRGLHGKISPRLQTILLIQSQNLHRKSLRLRIVSAQFVHSHHLQDRLISEPPGDLWTYIIVITVTASAQSICRRPRQSQLRPPHTGALYPTTGLQHGRPSPIGKTRGL